jgi:hypothetical protein
VLIVDDVDVAVPVPVLLLAEVPLLVPVPVQSPVAWIVVR